MGNCWARRLIQGAEGRGMEDLEAGDYREARMRNGRREPKSFIHVQQNKLLSKAEIHGSCTSAISRLPWNSLAHDVSSSSSAVAPRVACCYIPYCRLPAAVGHHMRGSSSSMPLACWMGSHCGARWWGEIKFSWHYKILPGCHALNVCKFALANLMHVHKWVTMCLKSQPQTLVFPQNLCLI